MKKILFCLMLVMVTLGNCNMVYGQYYDFTATAPSGQILYFKTMIEYDQNNHRDTVAVVTAPDLLDLYSGYTKPTGDLVIPTEVTNDGVTYLVTQIHSEAFMDCDSLTSVVIPESVTFIGYSVFKNCTSLTEVYYNAIRIPYDSHWHTNIFKGCTNLSRVIFGDNVRSVLCKKLFENITSLTHVTIGTSVDSISDGVFRGCSHLTTIESRAEFPPTITESTFEGVPAYADIIVPCGAAYRYELADYWKDFTRITEDCSAIGDVDDLQDIHVCVLDGCIVVEGVNNMEIDLFDMMGRLVGSTKDNRINVPTNGTYMLKIGNNPARKVVVVR